VTRLRPVLLTGVALAAAGAAAGCAAALKEAPPLVDLAGGGPPPDATAVASLLRQAEDQFAERTVQSVHRAAALYLRVASAEIASPAGAPSAATPPAGAPSTATHSAVAPPEGVVGAVQAQIWLTDHETEPAAREAAATLAVQAAQWCPRIAPGLPDCDFWLGAALGVQARERPTTGLSALPKIEAAFKRAAEAKPEMEDAGPDRALAYLYLRAPRWPRGPGDPEQGLAHAKKAVALRPDYPPNRLALAEALAAAGDAAGSLEAGHEALRLAEARVAQGDPDAGEWVTEARKSIDGGGRAKRS
jgi:tetratricopeptide (TPR) repeat protein